MATNSELHRSSQLEAAHALPTRFPARHDRWELAHPEGPAHGPVETEARAIPFESAGPLQAGKTVSEDAPARLPRPVLWLAFAGWVVCCGMLFVTLVQRESPAGPDHAWTTEPLLVATVSAALETVFGDPDRHTGADGGHNGTAAPPSTHLP